MQGPKGDREQRCGPQYRGWVSYLERPPSERLTWFLLIRVLSLLFPLGAAQAILVTSLARLSMWELFHFNTEPINAMKNRPEPLRGAWCSSLRIPWDEPEFCATPA